MAKTKTSLVLKRLARILWVALVVLFKRKTTRPQKLRLFFEMSGGAFIKLGQILAARQDFLPPRFSAELLKLRGKTLPAPFSEIQNIFVEESGETVGKFFSEFGDEPIASASIAQVYKAKLHNGETVAVKIQRPDTIKVFETDFAAIKFLAAVYDFFNPSVLVGAREIAEEFIKWTRSELDFRYETGNAIAFSQYSQARPATVIPKHYPQFSFPRVVVQEFIDNGFSAGDADIWKEKKDELVEKNIEPDILAEYLTTEICRQYFVDGFFHADPHPANIIFLPDNRLAFLDFGIVAEAEKENRRLLLKIIGAFSARSAEDVAALITDTAKNIFNGEVDNYIQSDILKSRKTEKFFEVIKNTIFEDFKNEIKSVVSAVVEPQPEESAASAGGKFSGTVFSLLKAMKMKGVLLPLDVLLFLRSLALVEEIALQMSPSFDIIKAFSSFFDEFPAEKVEDAINNETNREEIGAKIRSVSDDWEKFTEEAAEHKENIKASRERVMETVVYYAEKYPEVYEALKELKKKKTI